MTSNVLATFLARRKEDLADDPKPAEKPEGEEPAELIVAATDVLEAWREGSARDLAKALHAFFVICDSMPHEEGSHE